METNRSSLFLPGHLHFAIEFLYVDILGIIPDQVFAEVVRPQPEEILVHVSESMSLPGKEEEIEALIGLDEGMGQSDGVGWMDVVVNVSGHDQQTPFQVFCDF